MVDVGNAVSMGKERRGDSVSVSAWQAIGAVVAAYLILLGVALWVNHAVNKSGEGWEDE